MQETWRAGRRRYLGCPARVPLNKIIRRVLLLAVAALTPPALWAAAQRLSALENMFEQGHLLTGLCVCVGFIPR